MTSPFYTCQTTIENLPIECECSVDNEQLSVEAVFVEVREIGKGQTPSNYIIARYDILDILSDRALDLLDEKCQTLYDEEHKL